MLALTPQLNQQRPLVPDGDRSWTGVLMRKDAGAIPPGFLADARNVRCRKGVAKTRRGVAKPAWANRTEPAVDLLVHPYAGIHGAAVFKDPNGLEWGLVADANGIWRTRQGNVAQSIPLPSGVLITGKVQLVQAFAQVFALRGPNFAPLVMSNFDDGFADIEQLWNATATQDGTAEPGYAPDIGSTAAAEVAYGPFISIATLTSTGTLATAVTAEPHGYVTGADVTIRNANQAEYNGRYNITVLNDTTFTYNFAGSGTPTATGTIIVSNMALYWKALGSLLNGVTSLTFVGDVATVTKNGHGFSNGQTITVSGVTGADSTLYNGTFAVTNATTNTFKYTMTGTPSAVDPDPSATQIRNNSVTLAGQSPDSNPEAWLQLFTVLPNCTRGCYVQDMLLVTTAYEPNLTTPSLSDYSGKEDYVVALNYLDPVHFTFVNNFRINQGSADALVDLVKFNDGGTVLACKDAGIYVLSGLTLDLSGVTLTDLALGYGQCGPGAGVVVGNDYYFLAEAHGVMSVTQTVQNKLQGVDKPLSEPVQDLIDRINWNFGAGARLTWWDSKLYVAVPLDDARQYGPDVIPSGATFSNDDFYTVTGLTPNATYRFTPGPGERLRIPNLTLPGDFTATNSQVFLTASTPTGGGPIGSTIQPVLLGVNNAILVYDFLDSAWQGRDDGTAVTPVEFMSWTLNGRIRAFFAAADGWVNLIEGFDQGDMVANGREEITTYMLTRGYTQGNRMAELYQIFQPTVAQHKRGRSMAVILATFNPEYTINVVYAGVNETKTKASNVTKSRTAYYQPWNAPAWNPSNVNDDFATPQRRDYSIQVPDSGLSLGSGMQALLFQETRENFKLTGHPDRYAQFEIINSTGALELRGVEYEAQVTQRRKGPMS